MKPDWRLLEEFCIHLPLITVGCLCVMVLIGIVTGMVFGILAGMGVIG